MCLSCLRSGKLSTRMPSMRTARHTARAGIERQLYWQFPKRRPNRSAKAAHRFALRRPFKSGRRRQQLYAHKAAEVGPADLHATAARERLDGGVCARPPTTRFLSNPRLPEVRIATCGRSRDPLANVKQRTKMSWLEATVVYAHKPVDRISPTSRQGLMIQSTSRSN